MIAANVEAAKFLHKRRIPAPYRVHAPPPASKYEDLQEFLKEFHLSMPPVEQVTPGDFSALLKKIRKRADRSLIESVLLRSQSLAVYQPGDPGHFGLALDTYTHFTSPIRRYPRSARASRDPPCARGRQGGRLSLQHERHGRDVRSLLAERAPRRRSRARRRRALQVRVDGKARRQRVRRHRFGRDVVRAFRQSSSIRRSRGSYTSRSCRTTITISTPCGICSRASGAGSSSGSATRSGCRCCARAWKTGRSISGSSRDVRCSFSRGAGDKSAGKPICTA